MEKCPNCGYDGLWVTTDEDGHVWFHCLNKRCHESWHDKLIVIGARRNSGELNDSVKLVLCIYWMDRVNLMVTRKEKNRGWFCGSCSEEAYSRCTKCACICETHYLAKEKRWMRCCALGRTIAKHLRVPLQSPDSIFITNGQRRLPIYGPKSWINDAKASKTLTSGRGVRR